MVLVIESISLLAVLCLGLCAGATLTSCVPTSSSPDDDDEDEQYEYIYDTSPLPPSTLDPIPPSPSHSPPKFSRRPIQPSPLRTETMNAQLPPQIPRMQKCDKDAPAKAKEKDKRRKFSCNLGPRRVPSGTWYPSPTVNSPMLRQDREKRERRKLSWCPNPNEDNILSGKEGQGKGEVNGGMFRWNSGPKKE